MPCRFLIRFAMPLRYADADDADIFFRRCRRIIYFRHATMMPMLMRHATMPPLRLPLFSLRR